MVLPTWLMGLGAGLQGMQQAAERKKRQQMAQALQQQQQGQHPGGFGASPAMPSTPSWGSQNTASGGVVRDQWGNPIGPAAQPAGSPGMGAQASIPPAPPPPPSDPFSQGASPVPFAQGAVGAGADPNLPYQPPELSPQAGVPFMGGPNQAMPPQGMGGYQAPGSPIDDAMMNALFSPQGA